MSEQRIHAALAAAMVQRGMDRRTCYARVVPRPPGAGEIVVECSDQGVLDAVAASVGGQGPPVRYERLPRAADHLPPLVIASSSVADVRRDPAHTSELITQIVYGDAAIPLLDAGEWMLVRLDDGYIGWIRTWHLHATDAAGQEVFREAARHRIATRQAEVLEAPDADALPVADLVVGTAVVVRPAGRRGWRSVGLPDGRVGFVRSRVLEPLPRRRRPSRERLAATGLRFLGVPYLWGGTTPRGFDCSGLIQRIFRLNGVVLPRDADMQSRFGRHVPSGDPGALEVGSLLFFGESAEHITHVAMTLPDGLFLHAYGHVRVGSLDPAHPLYEARLDRIWRASRDPLRRPIP